MLEPRSSCAMVAAPSSRLASSTSEETQPPLVRVERRVRARSKPRVHRSCAAPAWAGNAARWGAWESRRARQAASARTCAGCTATARRRYRPCSAAAPPRALSAAFCRDVPPLGHAHTRAAPTRGWWPCSPWVEPRVARLILSRPRASGWRSCERLQLLKDRLLVLCERNVGDAARGRAEDGAVLGGGKHIGSR